MFGAFGADHGIQVSRVQATGERGHHLAAFGALAAFGGVWHCERQNMEGGAPAWCRGESLTG